MMTSARGHFIKQRTEPTTWLTTGAVPLVELTIIDDEDEARPHNDQHHRHHHHQLTDIPADSLISCQLFEDIGSICRTMSTRINDQQQQQVSRLDPTTTNLLPRCIILS